MRPYRSSIPFSLQDHAATPLVHFEADVAQCRRNTSNISVRESDYVPSAQLAQPSARWGTYISFLAYPRQYDRYDAIIQLPGSSYRRT
jgi:hypothetical protein